MQVTIHRPASAWRVPGNYQDIAIARKRGIPVYTSLDGIPRAPAVC